MRLILALSNQCNRSCAYCYADGNRGDVMSRAIAERAVDFALERSVDQLRIAFFGGEPLLHFDLIRRVVDYSLSHASTIAPPVFQLATNGDHLTDGIAEFLRKHEFEVSISVHDGELHNLPSSIRLLHAHGVRPRPVLVAGSTTAEALPEKARMLFTGGVRRIGISPDYYAEWDPTSRARLAEAYDELATIYKSRSAANLPGGIGLFDIRLKALRNHTPLRDAHCSLGQGKIAVAPNGELYPCDRMAVESCGAAWAIGNVATGVDAAKWERISSERVETPEQCVDCLYRPVCTYFCACVNVHLAGRICAACDTVCWHESMLGDIVFSLKADLDARQLSGAKRPPRGLKRAATGLAAAGALTLSCDRAQPQAAPPEKAETPIPVSQPSAQPSQGFWVHFPGFSEEPLVVSDLDGVKLNIRLRVCIVSYQVPLDELLDHNRAAVFHAVEASLSQRRFVSLAHADTMQEIRDELLGELMTIVDEKVDLRAIEIAATDNREATPDMAECLEQLKSLGYIGGYDD